MWESRRAERQNERPEGEVPPRTRMWWGMMGWVKIEVLVMQVFCNILRQLRGVIERCLVNDHLSVGQAILEKLVKTH